MVRIHACHAWGHGFESRTHRFREQLGLSSPLIIISFFFRSDSAVSLIPLFTDGTPFVCEQVVRNHGDKCEDAYVIGHEAQNGGLTPPDVESVVHGEFREQISLPCRPHTVAGHERKGDVQRCGKGLAGLGQEGA